MFGKVDTFRTYISPCPLGYRPLPSVGPLPSTSCPPKSSLYHLLPSTVLSRFGSIQIKFHHTSIDLDRARFGTLPSRQSPPFWIILILLSIQVSPSLQVICAARPRPTRFWVTALPSGLAPACQIPTATLLLSGCSTDPRNHRVLHRACARAALFD